MKTVFDPTSREELIQRVKNLSETSTAQWGKMNVSQMVKHCSQWDDLAQGITTYKQSFLGKLFGKMALKDMMKDQPVKKNLPTVPSFVIKDQLDLDTEKDKWIKSLQAYANYSPESIVHPFFGRLTKEQTGYMVYKHVDHHLQQFGC